MPALAEAATREGDNACASARFCLSAGRQRPGDDLTGKEVCL